MKAHVIMLMLAGAEPATEPAPEPLYVQASTVNVREKPAPSGTLVGTPRIGTMCTRVSTQEDWTEVDCAGVRGWVKSEFLAARRPDPAPLLATFQDEALPLKERLTAANRLLALGGPEARSITSRVKDVFVRNDLANLREVRGTKRFKTKPVKLQCTPANASAQEVGKALGAALFEESKGWHHVEYDAGTGDFLGIAAVPGGELRVAGGRVKPAAPKCSAVVEMDYRARVDASLEVALLGQEVPPPEKRPARTPEHKLVAKLVGEYRRVDRVRSQYMRTCPMPRGVHISQQGFELGNIYLDQIMDGTDHKILGAEELADGTIVLTYKGFDGSERHLSMKYPALQDEGYTFGYAGIEGSEKELVMRSRAAQRLPEDEESCNFSPE
ncbi:hypothetical protein JQX13_47025 [Archangium violaceum]|uniref:hypothetical protein n=1 Tax=Archangium violaceum TaxID=83451 RepID=UPI00193BF7D3|nr:hypothetical protein [Archangium violaceum]QRK07482.1 hypothetical protein JQX13_47025 [Archangium violaceum]